MAFCFMTQGVVNVVMGNAPDIGNALLASPQVRYPSCIAHPLFMLRLLICVLVCSSNQVRKITFTGSTAVGKKLMAGAAGTVKKVSQGRTVNKHLE